MRAVFRTIAILIALAGAVDPAIPLSHSRPVAVELRSPMDGPAVAVRERLLSALRGDVTLAEPGRGDAVVIIDDQIDAEAIRENVTISAVRMTSPPNVRVVRSFPSAPFMPGQEAAIELDVDVQDLAGRSSVFTVEQGGVEVGRVERAWTASGRHRVTVPFVISGPGGNHVRITALPLREETRGDDNAIDARVQTVDRPLRIAFVEPRPSWSGGFVRRALESDPAFEMSGVLRASRGIAVRTGDTPLALTASTLERFDVVVVGAPEELRATDLEALRAFMAVRGGTVFFLPDRRPSGPYAAFITATGFEEVLVEKPVTLDVGRGSRRLRASEFAIPRTPGPAAQVLATLADRRPAILSWPVGDGALVFSGALDAWRFRGDEGDPFAAFWRASIAAAALASPPRARVEVEPAVVRPGSDTRVTARIRRTEFEHLADGSIRLPTVRALALDGTGKSEPIRLWPTSIVGVYQGRFAPAAPGGYDVRVSAGGGVADATLIVDPTAHEGVRNDEEETAIVAAATRGVVVATENLGPLFELLRTERRGEVRAILNPMRSGWWALPFALALCAEWAIRRRRGGR